MKKVQFTHHAETELAEIASYIAEWNSKEAKRFVSFLLTKCRKLGDFPGMGTQLENNKAIQVFPVKEYLIFYSEKENEVEILHVVSRYRDLSQLYFQEQKEEG